MDNITSHEKETSPNRPEPLERAKKSGERYSTRAVAYLGDAVYEVYVREYLVKKGISDPAKLNNEAKRFVTASSQCRIAGQIQQYLTEDEVSVFKKGRNLGHTRTAPNIDPTEYRVATGLEVLFGQLFLEGKHARLDEIFGIISELKG